MPIEKLDDGGPMRQRIIAVGEPDGPLGALDPALTRASVEVHRVPTGTIALEMLRHFSFVDLLLVSYPLADMEPADLVSAVVKLIPSTRQPRIVLLAGEPDLSRLAAELPETCLLLSTDQATERLEQAASTFLRKAPRPPTRVMVRMAVELGIGKLFRLVQTVNISESGMLIRTRESLPLGSRVRFEIALPGGAGAVSGEAEVVRRTRPEVEGVAGLGLRFLDFDEEGAGRLGDFLQGRIARVARP